MTPWADAILVLIVLSSFLLLGSSRLAAGIRVGAGQGVLVGLLPLVATGPRMRLEAGAMAVAIVLLKGWVFPRLLLRALREAETTREAQPLIGHGTSLFAGVAMLWVATALALRVPRTSPYAPDLLVPVALSLLMTGVFLMVARRTAVSQVIGYLVLENGIYALGLALVGGVPVLIELGALMDLFVGVFAMGIAIFRINRAFDHIDADRLTALRG